MQVKAIACELPARKGAPLSRFSVEEIRRTALREGIVEEIGRTTIWRWLDEDALRPWRYRPWIFPRAPDFAERAGVVLGLYEGIWEGKALGRGCHVICADEKTSIQARRRCHATTPAQPNQAMRVEHEYERKGALAYLAAWDVFEGKVMGIVEEKTGIEPFGRLVDRVMGQEPYASAERVFWIVDNGSSHRRETFPERLSEAYENAVAIHLPVHASWLNQIEIYFSIVQRKVLTPNDIADRKELRQRLVRFEQYHNQSARPMAWTFTRRKLNAWLKQIPLAA